MDLNKFNYDLPNELIAQFPLPKRDDARLMIIDKRSKSIIHDKFYNIDKYLPEKSMLVFNDTKVIPARLLSKRETGGEVEIFLLKQLEDGVTFDVLLRPLRRLKLNEKIYFGENKEIYAQIVDRENPKVRFNKKNIYKDLDAIGHIPLPPYIKRDDKAIDKKFYQTVYAKKAGSVASPTAGLHFTNKLIKEIKNNGHTTGSVTLHVNYSTFKPVEEKDITMHKMHYEYYEVSDRAYENLLNAKKNGNKIVSVGTTSCRVLETIAKTKTLKGETNIFIYPGYKFKMIDCLITNFHLPFSSLLMLVYALGGEVLMKKAYKIAIKEKYRFFSYGDAMLII